MSEQKRCKMMITLTLSALKKEENLIIVEGIEKFQQMKESFLTKGDELSLNPLPIARS
jgi:hypothetical protein